MTPPVTPPLTTMTADVPRPMTFQPDIYAKVLGLLPKQRPCRILDVGAGEGYLSGRMAQLGLGVEACDFVPEQFQCPDLPFRQANLNQRVPYDDNTFDCTVSVEVIEHIEDHFTFVSELVRVTRPGGMLIVTTPNVLSLSSRWHFFLYGYTDCAPLPLDPARSDYFSQHVNPISLPELLFQFERCGAELTGLTTNRYRRSAFLPMVVLYPLLALALRRKLLRRKYRDAAELHQRHVHWMLRPANLLGRITIAQAIKRTPHPSPS